MLKCISMVWPYLGDILFLVLFAYSETLIVLKQCLVTHDNQCSFYTEFLSFIFLFFIIFFPFWHYFTLAASRTLVNAGYAHNLFAFPSECNFSGVRFSLDLVKIIKEDAERILTGPPFYKYPTPCHFMHQANFVLVFVFLFSFWWFGIILTSNSQQNKFME